jgi:hypothetical protein
MTRSGVSKGVARGVQTELQKALGSEPSIRTLGQTSLQLALAILSPAH